MWLCVFCRSRIFILFQFCLILFYFPTFSLGLPGHNIFNTFFLSMSKLLTMLLLKLSVEIKKTVLLALLRIKSDRLFIHSNFSMDFLDVNAKIVLFEKSITITITITIEIYKSISNFLLDVSW